MKQFAEVTICIFVAAIFLSPFIAFFFAVAAGFASLGLVFLRLGGLA